MRTIRIRLFVEIRASPYRAVDPLRFGDLPAPEPAIERRFADSAESHHIFRVEPGLDFKLFDFRSESFDFGGEFDEGRTEIGDRVKLCWL
jgi:hypothetical protein